MIRIAAVLGGFLVSLGMFAGGIALALTMLTSGPADVPAAGGEVAEVWTIEPRRVSGADQDYQRVPGMAVAGQTAVTPEDSGLDEAEAQDPGIDVTTTASHEPDAADESWREELLAAHMDWCAGRYRSYDAADNSYVLYRGGRRECVSPFLEEVEAMAVPPEPGDDTAYDGDYRHVADVGDAAFYENDDHIRACFARYRSYDPYDNSYQPYGGGPRRQCE